MIPRILMVISPQDFRDEEFLEPYRQFVQQQHWAVTVTSTQTGIAKGMFGTEYEITTTIEAQKASDYDALVIVGGMGAPANLFSHAPLTQLAQSFQAQNKTIAAICISGVLLANAGLLTGKNATVWECPESLEAYEKAHVNYVQQEVVIDGNIITGNGPAAADAFAQAIIKQLSRVAA